MVNRPVVVGGQNHSLHVSVPVSNTIYWSFRKGKNQLTTFISNYQNPGDGVVLHRDYPDVEGFYGNLRNIR